MEKGDLVRVRIGQDAHGQGGFTAMGRVVDENDHVLVVRPEVFLLVKNDVGSIDEMPKDAQVEEALRTVQVGRESYLGKTTPYVITSLSMDEEA